MKQHAVPENIMDVEFKLFGSLTAKQFGYIIGGGLTGIFLYYFFKSLGVTFLGWLFAILSIILGVSLALVRINDQPFEVWLGNFLSAMFTSQRRVWRKDKKVPKSLESKKTDKELSQVPVKSTAKAISAPTVKKQRPKPAVTTAIPSHPFKDVGGKAPIEQVSQDQQGTNQPPVSSSTSSAGSSTNTIQSAQSDSHVSGTQAQGNDQLSSPPKTPNTNTSSNADTNTNANTNTNISASSQLDSTNQTQGSSMPQANTPTKPLAGDASDSNKQFVPGTAQGTVSMQTNQKTNRPLNVPSGQPTNASFDNNQSQAPTQQPDVSQDIGSQGIQPSQRDQQSSLQSGRTLHSQVNDHVDQSVSQGASGDEGDHSKDNVIGTQNVPQEPSSDKSASEQGVVQSKQTKKQESDKPDQSGANADGKIGGVNDSTPPVPNSAGQVTPGVPLKPAGEDGEERVDEDKKYQNKADKFQDVIPPKQESIAPQPSGGGVTKNNKGTDSVDEDLVDENKALRQKVAQYSEDKEKTEERLQKTKSDYENLEKQNKQILDQMENLQTELEKIKKEQESKSLPPISPKGEDANDAQNVTAKGGLTPKVYNGPSLTKKPNVLSGIVKSKDGNLLPGVVVIVKSDKRPVRAMKTNSLGQFVTTTALDNGSYMLELSKGGETFGRFEIELTGEVLPTYEFAAGS